MKRAQIQLDETMFEQLRREAFSEQTSIADVVRRILHEHAPVMSEKKEQRPMKRRSFSFIGLGISKGKGSGSIAHQHDEDLVDGLHS